jgi:hypothetical protein
VPGGTKAATLRISDGRIKSASLQASVDAHKAFVRVAASPIRFAGRDVFVNWVALTRDVHGVDSRGGLAETMVKARFDNFRPVNEYPFESVL